MCLCNDRSKTTAAKMSTHLGDETESARPIAAFSDFDERVVRRRGQHARCRLVVQIRRTLIAQRNYRQRSRVRLWIADTQDVVDLTGADERIDFRHLGFQLVAISLN